MHDPFVGTWELNRAGSKFDPNHNPARATMRWELETGGAYLMFAEGENEKGEPCVEKPQRLVPDSQPKRPGREPAGLAGRDEPARPPYDPCRSPA